LLQKLKKYCINNDSYFDNTINQSDQSIGNAVNHIVQQFVSSNFTGKIICLASDANLVQTIAKFRPQWNILAFTENIRLARELNLTWGTRTVHVKVEGKDLEDKAFFAVKHSFQLGLLKNGEQERVLVISESANPKINNGVWMGIYKVKEITDLFGL